MNELGIPVLIVLAALLLVVMFLGAMGVRRIQLRRTLGTFDASISTSPGKWVTAIARYGAGELEFLKLFSVSPLPVQRFRRSSIRLNGWRRPADAEMHQVQPGSVIVMLSYESREILVAMDYQTYNGLSAWLEAGPVAGVGTWRQD
ncbi:MAG: DUF2550 domain-containing protein [Paeniglutamicibacter terrestris]|uniref:DUF2550 domain-containing protein n=1 Tax=Paeniglutamicibacter sp. Y32M11 TaxID=2853258 RepID=UPI002107132E|nr:DUF2550 domain-containing protein [Paeniglutamicibacter sp. Y32M11]